MSRYAKTFTWRPDVSNFEDAVRNALHLKGFHPLTDQRIDLEMPEDKYYEDQGFIKAVNFCVPDQLYKFGILATVGNTIIPVRALIWHIRGEPHKHKIQQTKDIEQDRRLTLKGYEVESTDYTNPSQHLLETTVKKIITKVTLMSHTYGYSHQAPKLGLPKIGLPPTPPIIYQRAGAI